MPRPPEDCDRLETPPDRLGAPVVRDAGGAITDIYATPRGDDRYVNGQTRATLPLAEALALAPAGATVHLLPGMYYRAVALYDRRGRDGAPIRIRGTRAPDGTLLSRLCGTNAAGSIYPKLPDGDDYAFFRLTGCRCIEIADVAVQDCWPCFVYAEGCTGITLNHVEVQAGTYVLFARGRAAFRPALTRRGHPRSCSTMTCPASRSAPCAADTARRRTGSARPIPGSAIRPAAISGSTTTARRAAPAPRSGCGRVTTGRGRRTGAASRSRGGRTSAPGRTPA